jgi:hypothetical protein
MSWGDIGKKHPPVRILPGDRVSHDKSWIITIILNNSTHGLIQQAASDYPNLVIQHALAARNGVLATPQPELLQAGNCGAGPLQDGTIPGARTPEPGCRAPESAGISPERQATLNFAQRSSHDSW